MHGRSLQLLARNPVRAAVPRITALLAFALLAGPASADVVTDWNTTATTVTAGPAAPQIRAYALMHAAIHDAVNAVDRRYQAYAVDMKAPPGASMDAAVAAAGHAVLSTLVPAQKAALDAALSASVAKIPEGQARTDGLAIGKQVADRLLALRSDDGFTAKVEVKLPAAAPGVWQLTPGFPAPAGTQLGQMKPMAVAKPAAFDVGGPPPIASEQFARDFGEIKAIGARSSATRTADETAAAIFWTANAMAVWNAVARIASRAHELGVPETARLFALLNIAGFDSAIVAWEQKYRYNYWRPYNAIRFPGGPGNAALRGDPTWEPLLQTPGHPDYPSAHCVFSGAAAETLRRFFADDRAETSFTHPPLFGVTRSWKSFTEIETEVVNARVWAGIHFRTADEKGTIVGRKIGEYVVRQKLLPVKAAAR
jgi:hypothetical protein